MLVNKKRGSQGLRGKLSGCNLPLLPLFPLFLFSVTPLLFYYSILFSIIFHHHFCFVFSITQKVKVGEGMSKKRGEISLSWGGGHDPMTGGCRIK